jgi:hypothetical protein
MHQQLWGYRVKEKLYLGVREQKRLNTTDLHYGYAQDKLTVRDFRTLLMLYLKSGSFRLKHFQYFTQEKPGSNRFTFGSMDEYPRPLERPVGRERWCEEMHLNTGTEFYP